MPMASLVSSVAPPRSLHCATCSEANTHCNTTPEGRGATHWDKTTHMQPGRAQRALTQTTCLAQRIQPNWLSKATHNTNLDQSTYVYSSGRSQSTYLPSRPAQNTRLHSCTHVADTSKRSHNVLTNSTLQPSLFTNWAPPHGLKAPSYTHAHMLLILTALYSLGPETNQALPHDACTRIRLRH